MSVVGQKIWRIAIRERSQRPRWRLRDSAHLQSLRFQDLSLPTTAVTVSWTFRQPPKQHRLTAPPAAVSKIVQRRKGFYLKGYLERKPLEFLVDTGAETTLISFSVLDSLPRALRTCFQDNSSTLQLADGEDFVAKGPVVCNLTVSGRTIVESVYAAAISDSAILGFPALESLGFQMSVAGISKSQRKSMSTQSPSTQVRRITATRNIEVSANAEVIIKGKIHGQPIGQTLMIGPSSLAYLPEGLQVARSVVSANDNAMCSVRILNVSDRPLTIPRKQLVAEAETVTVIDTVASSKQSEEIVPEHLQQLFRKTCEQENLTTEVAGDLRQLLCKHANLFAKHDHDLGRTTVCQHDIQTGDTFPIRQPPRRFPILQQPEVDREVQKMLEHGIIEPGQSPWASPVVLVKKKDGTVRFCVDYRKLNACTRFDAYPLPRIDETLESLGGAKFFTTLDLISGYWQVTLTPEARQKSAFCVRGGLYLWNVMPFGLCNAPSTFERLVETVLRGLHWQTCLIYLDDVLIFGRTESELLSRMDEVFSRLYAAGLKLKPRKCKLLSRQTSYLGHVISGEGITVSPEKVQAVQDWPTSTSVTDIRSFLGTAGYYRRFIKDFAFIAEPLHRLTRSGIQFDWNERCQQAFVNLKASLCSAPVLRFPIPGAPYVLDTDASQLGIGAVLSQVVDGKERVLSYASRALSKPEQNYCVTRKELLSVYNFVKLFRPYLYGQ